MKVGVTSYSFTKHFKATGCSHIEMCDITKEIGFDGIEFVELDRVGTCPNGEAEAALKIKEHCEKIGLEVVAYTVRGDFLAEDLPAELARLRGCVDIAALMGAKLMRHDAAWAPRPVYGYTYKDAIEEIAPKIRELAEYAQSKGVKTCTENHGRFLQDAKRVKKLIDTVNHPNYGWLIDMGNFMGVDADIPASVEMAAPYAFHVHAKDNLLKCGCEVMPEGWRSTRGGNFLRATVPGHGSVPIQKCIHIVKQAGYNGYISLEFEGWEENLQALKSGHDYLRKLIV